MSSDNSNLLWSFDAFALRLLFRSSIGVYNSTHTLLDRSSTNGESLHARSCMSLKDSTMPASAIGSGAMQSTEIGPMLSKIIPSKVLKPKISAFPRLSFELALLAHHWDLCSRSLLLCLPKFHASEHRTKFWRSDGDLSSRRATTPCHPLTDVARAANGGCGGPFCPCELVLHPAARCSSTIPAPAGEGRRAAPGKARMFESCEAGWRHGDHADPARGRTKSLQHQGVCVAEQRRCGRGGVAERSCFSRLKIKKAPVLREIGRRPRNRVQPCAGVSLAFSAC